MEDFALDILIGQGPSARSVKVPVQPFRSLAPHRAGLLTSPLRARFVITHRLDFYQDWISRNCDAVRAHSWLQTSGGAAEEIARRSRWHP